MFSSNVDAYMTIEYSFSGIRAVEGKLIPVQWDLVINLAGIKDDTEEVELYQEVVNTSYQKIMYWLEYFFVDVVFVDAEEEVIITALEEIGVDSDLVYLPGTPADELIVRVLHSKISSIASDSISIGDVALRASDIKSTFHYTFHGDYGLPDATYIGPDSIHPVPWWERDDIDTNDMALSSTDELDRAAALAQIDSSHVLHAIVKDMERACGIVQPEDEEENTSAEVINITGIGEWEPKIV